MQRNVDDRDLTAAFDLEEVYRKSRAVGLVAVYYRFSENLQGSAPWPPEYFNGVSEAVCSEKVRFLGGVFERASQQAAEKGRSCGAVASSPFAQDFMQKFLTKTKYLLNPLFICVIRSAKCRKAPPEDQPERPLWRQSIGQSAQAARLPRSRQQR